MTLRIGIHWRSNPYALGPYIVAGRRALTVRIGSAVLCIGWGRR